MSLPAEQREAGAFLASLAGGAPPAETHISAVYVGRHDAWKLKKAVRLPFLDFTALAERRRFVEREYELNKPEAPDIYLGVLAIDRCADGTLALRPAAEAEAPLDWVLHMAPIPKDAFLDTIARDGGLTGELLDALGDCVARSHGRRPPATGRNSADALIRTAERCREDCIAAGLPSGEVEACHRSLRERLQALRFWLQAREDAGLVRRCHGDLHLGNICLWHGAPVLFDALEFDEAMATTDVGYDLAFLLMDLDTTAGRGQANRVMNRVLARSGDAGVSRGLPAFMSLRAMVRAYVSAASGDAGAAHRYLAHAADSLRPSPAIVVAVGGLQGSGKSTFARLLAPALGRAPGAVVLRSDELRKRMFGVQPEQHLPESGYTEDANAGVRQVLVETARVVASGGQSVIADATFLDPSLRQAIAGAAHAAACPFVGIWLTAPRDVLEDRLRHRLHDASDATVGVLGRSLGKDPGRIDWLRVDTGDAAEAERQIRRRIATAAEA